MSRFRLRSRAGSLLTSGVDYLATRDWQAVAGTARSKLQIPSGPNNDPNRRARDGQSSNFSTSPTLPRIKDMSGRAGVESVVLLPGWAQRRVARDRHPQGWATVDAPEDLEDGEIELHVSLHGFVSKKLAAPSRSQRIFNQMARQLAGLPRIQPQPMGSSVLDSSGAATFVEEPQQIDGDASPSAQSDEAHEHASERIARKLLENADDQTLVRLMENLHAFPTDSAAAHEAAKEANESSHLRPDSFAQPPKRTDTMLSGGSAQWLHRSMDEVAVFHQNLAHRLQDYWVYRSPHKDVHIDIAPVINGTVACDQKGNRITLASTRLTSDSSGQFEHRLVIPWHMLSAFCRHYADQLQATPDEIQAVEVKAKLLNPYAEATADALSESPWRRCPVQEDHARHVRVVSDIDDTVKHTGVVQGAKQILRNVFVLPYGEAEVKGVAPWYHAMTELGAGLHYVTNAPMELHSLVLDFLEAVRLPVSHLVLKNYPGGARSLLSSWFEPAGERKRANVVKILDDFRTSQFILIGDSGELDLELYCALAAERPSQVRGIFIRDVSSPATLRGESTAFSTVSAADKLPRASGLNEANALPATPRSAVTQPAPARRAEASEPAFFDTSYPPRAPTALDLPANRYANEATDMSRANRALSEQEIRQAQAFQTRLNKATSMLPRSTVFRLFREGGDVQEIACRLVRELQSGTRPADR